MFVSSRHGSYKTLGRSLTTASSEVACKRTDNLCSLFGVMFLLVFAFAWNTE